MKLRLSLLLYPAALLLAFAPPVSAAPDSGDSYVSYTGTAVAQRTDKFLYHETHVLQYRDGRIAGRVVLYTCQDGTAFARKTVTYGDSLSPDFVLEDASNGMREGIRSEGAAREVFFRGDRGAAEKSSAIPPVTGLVADSGFDVFVRSNWQALMQGQSLGMNFLVPSRLQEMGFKVQHVGSAETDGRPVEVFRLKVSGVLGLVAPSIDVYYDSSDRTLIRYVGLSDLRDAAHDNFQAEIDFRPGDRRPGDEQSMANARRAPLEPCK